VKRRTGRGNRIALLLIGLALLLGGAAGLLRGLNVWPRGLGAHHALIIDQPTRHWVADQPWFWPTAAAVSVLHSKAALTGTTSSPRLALGVTMAADADPAEAVGRIGQAVRRLREALEDDSLNATVRIRTGRPGH
jgi:hypothetical protein